MGVGRRSPSMQLGGRGRSWPRASLRLRPEPGMPSKAGFGGAEVGGLCGPCMGVAGVARASHVSPPEGPAMLTRIVLDLDETLVCAYNAEDVPESVRQASAASGVSSFELECFTADLDASGEPERAQVMVFERPGLREFLRRASRLGELVLFTAGLEGYARPLVDRIDPDGLISARLYRSATVSIGTRQHVKDLAGLGRDLRRTVIIDNNPFAFLLQPVNGVPCVPFFGGEGSDRQLLQVLLPLLETLSLQPDVRPFLSSHFRMPLWLRAHGVPVVDHHPT
ncbi:unnamed protein product [Closterium sp. NIES-65]|nr:unnamed protein product [Closterium sp. NIES-65]